MDLKRPFYILAIESSCDDTAAAVLESDKLLANEVAGQEIHQIWGGVVPELASRAHQQQIIPVVHAALTKAKISKEHDYQDHLTLSGEYRSLLCIFAK